MTLTAAQRRYIHNFKNKFNKDLQKEEPILEEDEEVLNDSSSIEEMPEVPKKHAITSSYLKDLKSRLSPEAAKHLNSGSNEETTNDYSDYGSRSNVGISGRGAVKGGFDLFDFPLMAHQVGHALVDDGKGSGESPKSASTSIHKTLGSDDFSSIQGMDQPIDVDFTKNLSFGVGDFAQKIYDKITGANFVPQNESEQKLAEYSGLLSGIFGGGFVKSLVTGLLKKAPSIASAVSSLGNVVKKIMPEGVKKAGSAVAEPLADVGKFLTRPGTLAEGVSGITSKYVTDEVTKDMDMESPLNRAIALGLGVGSDAATRLGGTALKGKLAHGLVSTEKFNLARDKNFEGLELSQVLADNTLRGNLLERVAQTIAETPIAGGALQKSRENTVKRLLRDLGISDYNEMDPHAAGRLAKEALKKFKGKRSIESDSFYDKAFGNIKEDERVRPIKKSSALSDKEYQDITSEYLKHISKDEGKTKNFFNVTSKERNKILDDFMHSPERNVQTFKLRDTEKPMTVKTDLRNIRTDRMVANNLLKELEDLASLSGMPGTVKEFARHINDNKGVVTVKKYEKFRKDLNKVKRSDGDLFYSDADITSLRDATRNDMYFHLEQLGEGRKKAFKDYLKFHSDWYSENPKDHVQRPLNKIVDATENEAFHKILNDLKKNNKLGKFWLDELDQKAAQKVYQELSGTMSFDPTNKEANLFKWGKAYNNLPKDSKEMYQQVFKKANPKAKITLEEVSELLKQARATLKHGNTSGTSYNTFLRKLMFPEPPKDPSVGKQFANFALMPLKAAYKTVPLVLGHYASKHALLDPKVISWIEKSNRIKTVPEYLKWINEANNYKFISKPVMKQIQSTFLEGIQERGLDED